MVGTTVGANQNSAEVKCWYLIFFMGEGVIRFDILWDIPNLMKYQALFGFLMMTTDNISNIGTSLNNQKS